MLWIKALHIVFVMSWFAGLFYLPRIFVNLAEEGPGMATERLLKMARKLYRFTLMLSALALIFGLVLYLWYGIGRGPGNGWMHAKLGLVVLILGYQHACGSLLKKFEHGINKRSHVWYRYFNEIPVVMLLIVVCLVVVKPF
ncbi:CopD family protein [Solimicrobium silvestre]|uniref:Protoporphyrinogen IX oxidase n=1 Tax=Solimicrobium silvestre TaxID=2099400 RepID=A0A2S9H551_9BURK|nr:CopD family protein [Solimicrobium silvestre]PRC95098.1 putative membrane protein [Solimicrobium silvestre]